MVNTPLTMNSDNSPLSKVPNITEPKTILVVEDNAGNFLLISRMLDNVGIRFEWKTSGYEVVEFAENLPNLDLILMDIRLPYEDGYAAFRKLRASERFKNTPVVAVTAVTGMEQMQAAKMAGFNGFIAKPLDPDRFPEQISRLLAGQSVWEYE